VYAMKDGKVFSAMKDNAQMTAIVKPTTEYA